MELTPRRLKLLLALLAMLGLAAALDGWQWLQARDWNARIADGGIAGVQGKLPPEARFAQAWHLGQAGELHRALALYQEVVAQGDETLARAARYNIGNLFLREALRAGRDGDSAAGLPYAELAKQAYRDALRIDPANWDARYNLERTLRLVPEAETRDAGDGPAPIPSERAITTMKGFTLGLP